jgi:predicted rRNA methylase YqxC with S4 and FtsJ domains
MFELALAEAPDADEVVTVALHRASAAIEQAGWRVAGAIESPVRGHHGARELLLHARFGGVP